LCPESRRVDRRWKRVTDDEEFVGPGERPRRKLPKFKEVACLAAEENYRLQWG
jgi:hypothetical protein